MNTLSAIALTCFMVLTFWSGQRAWFRSVCASDHWRTQIRQGTARLKGRSLPLWRPGATSCQGSHVKWKFTGKFVNNQRGSIELLGVGLLSVMALAVLLLTLIWQQRFRQVDEHLKQTLCFKTAMLETNLLVKRINRVNAVIAKGEVTSWALILLGGTGLLVKTEWEKVKKALQAFQEMQWGKSQLEFLKMKKRGCQLPLALWPSPYQWQGRLVRGPDGRALMRGKQGLWVKSTALATHWARWNSSSDLSPLLTWEMR